MDGFVVYRKFNSIEQANEMLELLRNNNIPYLVSDNSPNFDPTFTNSSLDNQVEIKLRQHDFGAANNLIQQIALSEANSLGADHYLYAFSDSELMEVISKADEWNEVDYFLAKKILDQRGKPINDAELTRIRAERLSELTRPERIGMVWVVAGFAGSLMVFLEPWLWGLPAIFIYIFRTFGITIGIVLVLFSKRDSLGKKYYFFDEQSRFLGGLMIALGIISIAYSFHWLFTE